MSFQFLHAPLNLTGSQLHKYREGVLCIENVFKFGWDNEIISNLVFGLIRF